ncbi:hypothetical protein CAPTEDRAFT_30194, partial [Capitella teleta]
KIYIGGLDADVTRRQLRSMFGKYGGVKSTWVAWNPPGFGFVEMRYERDAHAACEDLDGTTLDGRRLIVEMSSGESRWDK